MKAEHRREKRERVLLTAMLRWDGGGVEVRLSNLSSLGAGAEFPGLLEPGTRVRISRGDLDLPARIAWAVDGRIGIAFDVPLNVREFQTHGHAPAGFATTQLHKPVQKLSPRLERRWAEILKR